MKDEKPDPGSNYTIQSLQGESWRNAANTIGGNVGEYRWNYLHEAEAAVERRRKHWRRTAFRIISHRGDVVREYEPLDVPFPSATQKETTVDYESRKPLHVPRTTLIKKIEEHIASQKKSFDADQAERVARNEAAVAILQEAAKTKPQHMLAMIESYFNVDPDDFLDQLEDRYGVIAEPKFTPSPGASKLLSVLRASIDKEIEVTPSDDFYSYL